MAVPDLIYCGDGNRQLAQVAIENGMLYGARLPETLYFEPYFADQDFRRPDRAGYMAALEVWRPHMATVLDLDDATTLTEVLSWAEEAAQWVDVVVIIPKVNGVIAQLPRHIAGATVRLGYSVPTGYGGTEVPLWEFEGRPVHLLGGAPHKQMRLARYLDVRSVDGNLFQKMAIRWGAFWTWERSRYSKDRKRWFPSLKMAQDEWPWDGEGKVYVEAFRRSVINIVRAWREGLVT